MLREFAETLAPDTRPACSESPPTPAAAIVDGRATRSAAARSESGATGRTPHGTAGEQEVAPAGTALFAPGQAPGFTISRAVHTDEVREAQRLRYLVFAEEMGARLQVPAGSPPLHDIDRFDDHCEHLLVRPVGRDGQPGPVVGTYRLLPPAGARRAGGLYSETEFDLGALDPLREQIVELGRSCVHPQWRSGGVIMLLWTAMTQYMIEEGLSAMIGCASVSMQDGGQSASALWRQLSRTHLAPAQWHVTPRQPLPLQALPEDFRVPVPPLIRGYLRCGTKVLGPPSLDLAFNTADLPLMSRLDDLPPRLRKPLFEPS